jgi:hypothetical protein
MASEDPGPPAQEPLDEGPYGLRGKHTPPLTSMMGAYLIIFGVVVLVPLVLFFVFRVLLAR